MALVRTWRPHPLQTTKLIRGPYHARPALFYARRVTERHPYRATDSSAPRRAEFVYRTNPDDWPMMRWPHFLVLVTLAVVGFVATRSIEATVGAPALAFAFFYWRWRRLRSKVLLDVEGSDVFVRLHGARRPIQIPLRDLEAVELDTRTIQRIDRDNSIVGQLTAGNQLRSPSEESRIVLVLAEPRPPVALTDVRVRHSEALEWMGKLRVFLRAQGWRPASERDTD